MRDYKNIKAYQLADKFVLEVYTITKNFLKEEMYGLISQLRRSAVSIPCNIAEGASRQHKKDYLQFLYVARGSLSESEYLVNLSQKLQYLTKQQFEKISNLLKDTAMTLFGLIRSFEGELNKGL